jgi:cob(I)alamin adenosyltransferase
MVLGENDELSSRIGFLQAVIKTLNLNTSYMTILREIQRHIQDFNSHIATVDKYKRKLPVLEEKWILQLEELIDEMELELPSLTKFILPGVELADSQAQLCRTQTRKAERLIVQLSIEHPELIPSIVVRYMNRLSDFFFVYSRMLCYKLDKEDCYL